MGLRIPMARAEKLKIEEGSVILGNCLPGETVLLKDDSGFAGKEVERETLNTIIHLRCARRSSCSSAQLEEESFINYIGEGIFITGGCSQFNGIDHLAEEIFEMPARVAHAQTMSGLTSAFREPAVLRRDWLDQICAGRAGGAAATARVRSHLRQDLFTECDEGHSKSRSVESDVRWREALCGVL